MRRRQKKRHSCQNIQKSSIQSDGAFQMLALPIFPGSHPPSIVGACELNFCVRDGNRWTLTAINTNSYGWRFPPSFIVKSPPASNRFILAHPVLPVNCFLPELLVTRTGFEPMLKAWEASVLTTWPTGHGAPSRTRTGDPLIKSQLLYQLS